MGAMLFATHYEVPEDLDILTGAFPGNGLAWWEQADGPACTLFLPIVAG